MYPVKKNKIFHLVDPELKQIDWFCPVELISAKDNKNIESIWKHAEAFKNVIGEDHLIARR